MPDTQYAEGKTSERSEDVRLAVERIDDLVTEAMVKSYG